MNELNEREKELEEKFKSIQGRSFEERLAEIRPRMKKKHTRMDFMSTAFFKRFVLTTTSLILIFVVGLTFYLVLNKNDTPPEDRYLDEDIKLESCLESDVLNYNNLYVPNVSILFNTDYSAGRHIETHKDVYFLINGFHAENDVAHTITLMIIIDKRYDPPREELYTTGTKTNIAGREMTVLEDEPLEFFYNYKVGFKIDGIRYYLDYGTTSEVNDLASFMELFLK